MAKKFRKVYFICTNNKVFDYPYAFISAYRERDYAENVCTSKIAIATGEANMVWSKNKKLDTLKVEGFYLVHESLFDELLKQHTEEKPQMKVIKWSSDGEGK